ncbi:MAG: hypothetical protein WA172_13255 [Terriglobales bacterium]
MTSLNRAYSRLTMQRRYEAWFLRFGLADGSGAWWFRYLLTNLGRSGCPCIAGAAPAQVWATWFPRDGRPETVIQDFPLDALTLDGSTVGTRPGSSSPFSLKIGANRIDEDSCRGEIEVRGQKIGWDLRYGSHFGITLSNKGWIGFSRTPHSDAVFNGDIRFGDRTFRAEPLGFGLQGHNCGFRHRHFWTWMHACFPQPDGSLSTLEALVYEMPLGLRFRKVILWHRGQAHVFRKVRESCRDRERLRWTFVATSSAGTIEVDVDGSGISLHRLPYVKTDCSGTFEVSNNSRSLARLRMHLRESKDPQELTSEGGAVLEMTGNY